MILSWPPGFPGATIPRNSSSACVAELRDIFPTMLSVAGVAPARTLNGSSLTCLLRCCVAP